MFSRPLLRPISQALAVRTAMPISLTQVRLLASQSQRSRGVKSRFPTIRQIDRYDAPEIPNDPNAIVDVHMEHLSGWEQIRSLAVIPMAKKYGVRFGCAYFLFYLSNFALCYLAVTETQLMPYLIEYLQSADLDTEDSNFIINIYKSLGRSMLDIIESKPTYSNFLSAFILNDFLDMLRVPIFFAGAVMFMKRFKILPVTYRKKLPEHYFAKLKAANAATNPSAASQEMKLMNKAMNNTKNR